MNKFRYWNTAKLKEIIDSYPYYTCSNGKDYTNYIDEIKEEYYMRMNKTKPSLRQFKPTKGGKGNKDTALPF